MENYKKPAFPTYPGNHNGLSGEEYGMIYGEQGLPKREYFAAMAMQGYCANESIARAGITLTEKAQSAVMMADELIKELQK